jgi:hypothetical protein
VVNKSSSPPATARDVRVSSASLQSLCISLPIVDHQLIVDVESIVRRRLRSLFHCFYATPETRWQYLLAVIGGSTVPGQAFLFLKRMDDGMTVRGLSSRKLRVE